MREFSTHRVIIVRRAAGATVEVRTAEDAARAELARCFVPGNGNSGTRSETLKTLRNLRSLGQFATTLVSECFFFKGMHRTLSIGHWRHETAIQIMESKLQNAGGKEAWDSAVAAAPAAYRDELNAHRPLISALVIAALQSAGLVSLENYVVQLGPNLRTITTWSRVPLNFNIKKAKASDTTPADMIPYAAWTTGSLPMPAAKAKDGRLRLEDCAKAVMELFNAISSVVSGVIDRQINAWVLANEWAWHDAFMPASEIRPACIDLLHGFANFWASGAPTAPTPPSTIEQSDRVTRDLDLALASLEACPLISFETNEQYRGVYRLERYASRLEQAASLTVITKNMPAVAPVASTLGMHTYDPGTGMHRLHGEDSQASLYDVAALPTVPFKPVADMILSLIAGSPRLMSTLSTLELQILVIACVLGFAITRRRPTEHAPFEDREFDPAVAGAQDANPDDEEPGDEGPTTPTDTDTTPGGGTPPNDGGLGVSGTESPGSGSGGPPAEPPDEETMSMDLGDYVFTYRITPDESLITVKHELHLTRIASMTETRIPDQVMMLVPASMGFATRPYDVSETVEAGLQPDRLVRFRTHANWKPLAASVDKSISFSAKAPVIKAAAKMQYGVRAYSVKSVTLDLTLSLALAYHLHSYDQRLLMLQQAAFLTALEEETKLLYWLVSCAFSGRSFITTSGANQRTGTPVYLSTLSETRPGWVLRHGGQRVFKTFAGEKTGPDVVAFLKGLHRDIAATFASYVSGMLKESDLVKIEAVVLSDAGHQRVKARTPDEARQVMELRTTMATNLSSIVLDIDRGEDPSFAKSRTYAIWKLLDLVLSDATVKDFTAPFMHEEEGRK
jgi:hypothetical protein